MTELRTILFVVISVLVVAMSLFLISENRRPQSTLAWLLAFLVLPGVGIVIYVLFGRDRKAFSKQSRLLMQDLEPNAGPLLAPLLDRQDEEIAHLEDKGFSHRKLMMLVRRNSRSSLTRRNQVEILQDATTFYPRLMEDIKAAKHSIHLQYYIWRTDRVGEQLRTLLMEKRAQGVEVRLLYDPIGSYIRMNHRSLKMMRNAGIKIVPTSPLYQLHTISYRNHRKITVIDGRIGYTGGMNIGQEHLDGGKGFDSWRDTQLRIVGEGAAILQAVFMVDWYNAVREDLFAAEYFPQTATEPESGDVPVQILTSGPDSQWAAIRQLYSNMIVTARRHVFMQSPYFILDAGIAEALALAALSGVDVQVMLSARASGSRIPAWASNTYILDAIKAGVRVFGYEKGYLHAKTISIDSEICSIGSANLDIRSFSINYELNAVLYDARLAQNIEQDFRRDLAHCTEFDPVQYNNGHPVVRFRDSVARLLSPLL